MTKIFDGDFSTDAQAGSVLTATPPESPNRRASEFFREILDGSDCTAGHSLPLVSARDNAASITSPSCPSANKSKTAQPCTKTSKRRAERNPESRASCPGPNDPNPAKRRTLPFSDYPAEVKTVRLVPPYISNQPCASSFKDASSPAPAHSLESSTGQLCRPQGLGISLCGRRCPTLLDSFARVPGRTLPTASCCIATPEVPRACSPSSTIKLVPRLRMHSEFNGDSSLGKFGLENTLDSIALTNDISIAVSVPDTFDLKSPMLPLGLDDSVGTTPLDVKTCSRNNEPSPNCRKQNGPNAMRYNTFLEKRSALVPLNDAACPSPASSAKLSPEAREMMDNIRRTKRRIFRDLAEPRRETTL